MVQYVCATTYTKVCMSEQRGSSDDDVYVLVSVLVSRKKRTNLKTRPMTKNHELRARFELAISRRHNTISTRVLNT